MANEEQVALLKQGSKVWNAWKEKSLEIEINLRGADFRYANLRSVDLSSADLSYANLREANLREANLREADLRGTDLCSTLLSYANLSHANLIEAKLGKANLSYADLSYADLHFANLIEAYLIEANLSYADLRYADLRETDLGEADLSSANLRSANLSYADLHFANLREANLRESRVLYTNFDQATLTGACIADWQISSSTILDNVECDYVFRTYGNKYVFRTYDDEKDDEKGQFSGRLPIDVKSTFALGEFTRRFQIIASVLETIDITFTEGIDWQAFFQSFQDLRASRPDEDISIQGMERKGDAFVVRLEVEAEADKAAIETEVKQRYAHQLAALEAQYEERLRLQGAHLEDARRTIESERQRNTEILGVIGIVAQTQGSKYDMRGSNFGNFVDTAQPGSRVQSIQHIYAPEQQDLSEAAKEIQALLNTLAETYNTTTDAGKEQLMKELGKEVEKHPKWRRALKAGGIELIKVLCAPIGVPLEMARVYLEDEE